MTKTTILAVIAIFEHKNDKRNSEKISAIGRRRQDRQILRKALRFLTKSSFQFLYSTGCYEAMITLTGLDHKSFRNFIQTFAVTYIQYTPIPKTDRYVYYLSLLLAGSMWVVSLLNSSLHHFFPNIEPGISLWHCVWFLAPLQPSPICSY